MTAVEDLKQWLRAYLKSKDVVTKSIVAMEEGQDTLFVEYTSKKQLYIIHPRFEDKQHLLTQLSSKEYPIILITRNTEYNLRRLIAWWDILSQYPQLSIYFVGDYDKWVIVPFSHARIAEAGTLEKGLYAIATGIGFVPE